LLTDEKERLEVGRRARERVLREHAYQQRARELVRIVQGG
jgi:spore maturation protein CgeB